MLQKTIFATLTSLLLAVPAMGQDALGRGDALDANPSRSGRSNLPHRSTAADFRYRNLLVTGSVAGGRGFRGTVGYTAASDFRGDLGSNDLFQFRSTSALSNPAFVVNQGRYRQFELGYALGSVEYRREGSGSTAAMLGTIPSQMAESGFRGTSLNLDRLTASLASSARDIGSGQRNYVGGGSSEDSGMFFIASSSLRGLTRRSLNERLMLDDMPMIDQVWAVADINNGRQYQFGNEYAPDLTSVLAKPLSERIDDQRLSSEIGLQYDGILTTLASRFDDVTADDENKGGPGSGLPGTYNALRDVLLTRTGNRLADAEDESGDELDPTGDGAGTGETTTLRDRMQQTLAERVASITPEVADDEDTLDDVATILQHNRQIDNLASEADDRFTMLIRQAQRDLEDDSYFRADRGFDRALQFVPGHPMALSGKANALLGAGLYPAAAATLEQLFSNSPEMIDVQYSSRLLPKAERLEICVTRLRDRLSQEDTTERHRAMGLLLAYIGHQQDDAELVIEGLAVMQVNSDLDDLLPGLLRRVWKTAP